MDLLKGILKFMLISSLIVGGVLVGVTVFASKKIDNWGDKLQLLLHKGR